MARKREPQLRLPIDRQEDWNSLLSKQGLCVVDVYQEWCKPCVAIESIFRKIKNELGDDLLHFAVAKSDTIDSLINYRGQCEPCFLFYAGGVLVAKQRGVNAPVLSKMIVDQLQKEHLVIKGAAEREEIYDPHCSKEKVPTQQVDDNKIVAIAIIKPDIVAKNKVDEIINFMKGSGIQILKREDRQLTENEANELYKHLKDEEYFNDIVEYVCSGKSCILAISKKASTPNFIEEFRAMIGPKNVEEARESAPDSLRAHYGKSKLINAIHGSSDLSEASRELNFFFPDFNFDLDSRTSISHEQTLALIRPDGVKNFKDNILANIEERGFKIIASKEIQLSREQAEEFYSAQKDAEFFETLIDRMTSGVSLVLILDKNNSISEWRELLGPKIDAEISDPESLRAKFKLTDVPINLIHGSSSTIDANKEIEYFFPIQRSLVIIKTDQNSDDIINRIKDQQFKIEETFEIEPSENVIKRLFGDAITNDFISQMKRLTCLIINKMDAIHHLQVLAGPEDPKEATHDAPNSIRASFGQKNGFNGIFFSVNVDQFNQYLKCVKETEEVNVETACNDENNLNNAETAGDDGNDENDLETAGDDGNDVNNVETAGDDEIKSENPSEVIANVTNNNINEEDGT